MTYTSLSNVLTDTCLCIWLCGEGGTTRAQWEDVTGSNVNSSNWYTGCSNGGCGYAARYFVHMVSILGRNLHSCRLPVPRIPPNNTTYIYIFTKVSPCFFLQKCRPYKKKNGMKR